MDNELYNILYHIDKLTNGNIVHVKKCFKTASFMIHNHDDINTFSNMIKLLN